MLFPVFWAYGGQWTVLIEVSTQPCYAVLTLWKASLAYQLATGEALRPLLPAEEPQFVGACLGLQVANTVGALVVFGAFSKLLNMGFPAAATSKKKGK